MPPVQKVTGKDFIDKSLNDAALVPAILLNFFWVRECVCVCVCVCVRVCVCVCHTCRESERARARARASELARELLILYMYCLYQLTIRCRGRRMV